MRKSCMFINPVIMNIYLITNFDVYIANCSLQPCAKSQIDILDRNCPICSLNLCMNVCIYMYGMCMLLINICVRSVGYGICQKVNDGDITSLCYIYGFTWYCQCQYTAMWIFLIYKPQYPYCASYLLVILSHSGMLLHVASATKKTKKKSVINFKSRLRIT